MAQLQNSHATSPHDPLSTLINFITGEIIPASAVVFEQRFKLQFDLRLKARNPITLLVHHSFEV
jgi:hypothetical protein